MKRRDSIHISTYDRPTMVDMNDYKGRFEPTTNKHQWSRWRIAVNDTLCDQKALTERLGSTVNNDGKSVSVDDESVRRNFPKFLSEAPYKEFVKVTNETIFNAEKMMITDGTRQHRESLGTGQFIYFGIPRISLGKKTPSQNENDQRPLLDVYIADPTDMQKKQTRKVVRF